MPFIRLQFKPGLNKDQTNYSGEGGWWDCDKVRFLSGYPQKIGGWAKQTPNTFLGTSRGMWNWVTTYGDNLLGIGTNLKLYVEIGGYFYDITPLKAKFNSPATDDCISVSDGSKIVTVSVNSSNAIVDNYVQLSGITGSGSPENIGGIPVSELNGTHKILSAVDGDHFTFAVDTAATSNVSSAGGTDIELRMQINVGYVTDTYGYGWGAGSWSRLAWGLGSLAPVTIPARTWWLSNFDNDLVANINKGPIYYWERGNGSIQDAVDTNAVLLSSLSGASDVPAAAMQTLVSQNDKHLLALGCVPFGSSDVADFDPLLIRWANQDEPKNWTPTPTNSAGFIRLARGSAIVRGLVTRQEILVWTESTLNSVQFTGTTDVFALQELADNISIIGPRAVATVNNITYWMGHDKFYMYSGRVDTLPCTLRQHIFQDISFENPEQIICGTNEAWNEVWWVYASKGSSHPNKYVVYNHFERIWYYGTIDRTAWLDSPLREYPMSLNTPAGSEIGYLYNQEYGVDADGLPLVSYIQSNDFDIADGEQFMLSRRMIPDVNFSGSTATNPEVTLQVRPRNFPGSQFQNSFDDSKNVIETSVDSYTDQVFMRARGRQMAIKISSDEQGVAWQLGTPRLDARTDGKR